MRFAYAVRDLSAADRPWIAAETFLWSIIEVHTGLICACVPVLKPLFRHVLPTRRDAKGERRWPFLGKRRKMMGLSGETLNDEDRRHSHGAYIELEHGKGKKSRNFSTGSPIGQGTLGFEAALSETGTLKSQV